ncbi:MAG: hypothetical protein CM15mP93_16480 [Thiotrichaceae bacterium]|nr:MAG: hypothetical protein CM15mP93_16480 [Thiotrichaceae bacterium]
MLKWNDSLEIAIQLCDKFPEIDPQYIRFTDLHQWICELDDFNDKPDSSNEKILEAIQMAWIEEKNNYRRRKMERTLSIIKPDAVSKM